MTRPGAGSDPRREIKTQLRQLYLGESAMAVRFRYGLLMFDILTLTFLFISSFYHGSAVIEILDVLLGVIILADISARFWISDKRGTFLFSLHGVADILTVTSLLLPLLGENLAFLRVVRSMRLFRSYEMISRLRRDFRFFRQHEDIVRSAVNLLVFLFVMTALVYETQEGHNDKINNYIDALYYTVTALTTTGFGDITLVGDSGKLIAVVIMIIGVSLFLRLIQTVFRPVKVRFTCPDCALNLHDRDAVHCKHCGHILNIPDEGLY